MSLGLVTTRPATVVDVTEPVEPVALTVELVEPGELVPGAGAGELDELSRDALVVVVDAAMGTITAAVVVVAVDAAPLLQLSKPSRTTTTAAHQKIRPRIIGETVLRAHDLRPAGTYVT